VELAPERCPAIQKRIGDSQREAGKPVNVATQMLESMITTPVPTRAEVSDVANRGVRRRGRGHAVRRIRVRQISEGKRSR